MKKQKNAGILTKTAKKKCVVIFLRFFVKSEMLQLCFSLL